MFYASNVPNKPIRRTGLIFTGTPALSCSDLPAGVDMVDISANVYSRLSCDVFTPTSNCLRQIATVDGYNSEQLQALSAKLSQVRAITLLH